MGMQSKGFQGEAASIRDIVQLISMHRQPSLDQKASSFVAQAAALVPNFVTVENKAESGDSQRLWGKAAIAHLFKEGEMKNKEGSWPSTLKDVDELKVYGFCLNLAQKKKVQEWVASILTASGIMGSTKAESDKVDAKCARRKQNMLDTEALVDQYFDN
eukprot:5260844-Lingulodinium_polyedra.AAC.1